MSSIISLKVAQVLTQCNTYNATLCLATKNQDVHNIHNANISASLILAENRIQELEEKWQYYKNISNEKHFIGRLQKNKVRKAVNMCDVIQSVDSLELLERIDRIAAEEKKIQKIFLNINISEDPHKSGFTEQVALHIKPEQYKNISITGIFTILAFGISRKEVQKYYKNMKQLQTHIRQNIPSCTEISMGMSNDYNIALTEGATIVRVGSGIFGQRQ